jgi:hypothetical protein
MGDSVGTGALYAQKSVSTVLYVNEPPLTMEKTNTTYSVPLFRSLYLGLQSPNPRPQRHVRLGCNEWDGVGKLQFCICIFASS